MRVMNILLHLLIGASLCLACNTPSDDPVKEQPQEKPQEPQDPEPPGDGVLRILAVGNSFSADAVEQELWPLFHAAGQDVIIAQLYIAGCDLETHLKTATGNLPNYSYRKIVDGVQKTTSGATFLQGLRDEEWDYISLQQGGGHHGQYETFEPSLGDLIAYCRENAVKKDFKLVYHACWAAPANSTNAKFGFYGYDQAKMYAQICDATQKADALHHFDLVINSMDAIQNGRSSYLGDTFDRDGWHLNKSYGRYTAACIWYEKISGRSVMDNGYHPDSISDYVAGVCKTAAHQACLHPYRITDLSSMFTDPDPKPEGGKVLARWEFSAVNAVEDAYITTFTGLPSNSSGLGAYAYSNKSGERGYIASNKDTGGRMSFVQVDKSAWSDASGNERAGLMVSAAGLPTIAGCLPGDCLLFETLGKPLSKGSTVRFSFSWNSNKYGSKYWLLEYFDGAAWTPVPDLPVKTETVSGTTYDTKESFSDSITYNIAFAASEKRTLSTTVTLPGDVADFKIRMTCAMEYQVNGRHFLHPRTQSVQNLDSTVQPVIELL
ncbi:MAG: DUF4886 domain-containing protein [Bacteroidales bacterium]|nr:DUF4886 domain-containing protein [Bacteroidales bacterium]MBR0084662.1 DUF4886 domain-containing protein [Bacteroidales bacterium]MBR0291624.1 DUF4886 domain-containing protein [Bacteroidales bacterium]